MITQGLTNKRELGRNPRGYGEKKEGRANNEIPPPARIVFQDVHVHSEQALPRSVTATE
jgi:hypothetical protein